MKAIVVREYGEPNVMKLEEVSDLQPNENQVMVKIKAAGVNPVDTYVREGNHVSAPPVPFTPGKDAAGIVEEIGSGVSKVKVGDRVYLAGSVTGTYAETALCEENQVWSLPETATFEQGAGIFVPYATAYRALIHKAKPTKGETVLIHGASGAVGVAAIQWAKNVGLTVIGTASSDEGKRLVKEQGADFVFDHSKIVESGESRVESQEKSYLDEINEVTNGNGVDIILEMLANVNLVKDFDVLAKFGRIVVIGNRGSLEFNPRLTMGKDATIYGVALFNASEKDFEEIHSEIYKGLSEGFLNPIVGRRFSLQDAPQAHIDVMETKAFGKIVLEI